MKQKSNQKFLIIFSKLFFCTFIYFIINFFAYLFTLLTTDIGCCAGGADICFSFVKKMGCVHLSNESSSDFACSCSILSSQNPIIVLCIIVLMFLILFRLGKKEKIDYSWIKYFSISGVILFLLSFLIH